jgi:DNA-binding transcriptional regulator GbsR (MarR family)
MQAEEQEFIDRWSRILAAEGLPPIAGRLWAWLMISEPPDQTVEEIAEAIGASRGAISGAVRWLEPSGLIIRTKRRGDRREYWRTSPDAMVHSLEAKERATRPSLNALNAIIAALPHRTEESLSRLREAQRLYAMLLDMFPALIAQFKIDRAAQPAPSVPSGKD